MMSDVYQKPWKQNMVNQWRQKGEMSLWTYTRNIKNFPGWHLSADHQGCVSFLDLCERMMKMTCSSERTIVIRRPTVDILMVPGNQGGYATWRYPERLKLRYLQDSASQDVWHIEEVAESNVLLTLGVQHLNNLKEGIQGLMEGKGDYAIGTHELSENSISMCLWFW